MKGKIGIAIAVGALASAIAATASAQTMYEEGRPYMQQHLRAPVNAFEIGVNGGYTQGFGDIQRGQRVGSLADAGFSPGITLGWRATPGFAIAWSGNYQEFKADNALTAGTNARGLTSGIQADFHILPYQRVDPFITAGAGYRMLWLVPNGANNNTLIHGFELGKLQAGLDVRLSPEVAIAPVVGADLNMFVWTNPEGPTGNVEIPNKRVNTYLFAGAQGRFDLGGYRRAVPVAVVGSR